MTPPDATRPVLIAAAALACAALSGCGGGDAERIRFQSMAERVAEIDIPLQRVDAVGHRDAASFGLRSAKFSPVTVSVMDPHDMWDARDARAAGLRGAVTQAVEPVPAAAAPLGRAAASPQVARRPEAQGRSIQLGAYSSEAGARAAWSRLKSRSDMASLSPVFEVVQVEGRSFTRLKVGPVPADQASAVCRAAEIADTWCARQS